MTSDRLRQMADAATQDWPYGIPWWDYYYVLADRDLVCALGPDAARLLADAMEYLGRLNGDYETGLAEVVIGPFDADVMRDMLARFASLGEQQP